jgi:hypothetical protein
MQQNIKLDFYLNEEELLQRHLQSKPPALAYLFFPKGEQVVEYDIKKPKQTLRRIFECKHSDLLPHELKYLAELHLEILKYNSKNQKKLEIPVDYSQYEISRFLQATGFDYTKTIGLLKENIEWRKTLIPKSITNRILEILNCGFMYIFGRDNNFRPILVINVDYYEQNKNTYSYEEWQDAIIYFMEYTINNQLIPGQVENWTIITDFGSVSFFFLPSNVKKLMSVLQSNYRCRLYVNYILNMSSIIRGIYNMIKGLLDPSTEKKIKLLDNSNRHLILTNINEEQVERRFGGKAPDLIPGKNRLFPPNYPGDNILKKEQTDLKEAGLVSEDVYKQMYHENRLNVVSEYYLNKWKSEEERKKNVLEEEIMKKLTVINEVNEQNSEVYSLTSSDSTEFMKVTMIEDNELKLDHFHPKTKTHAVEILKIKTKTILQSPKIISSSFISSKENIILKRHRDDFQEC